MNDRRPVNARAYQRESFCKANFPLRRIHTWSGTVCLVPMTRRRVARLELVGTSGADCFAALEVRIVHADRGKIDQVTLPFGDFMHDRADDRADYELRDGATFHTWMRPEGRFEWYIAVPTEGARETLMAAAAHYIEVFER